MRRIEVVDECFRVFNPDVTVETGTYLGATTGFLARRYGVEVYSCEAVARHHYAAQRMLRQTQGVHLYHGDSRSFLKEIAARPGFASRNVFFYLDAHWEEDLPLAEEIQIIASHWRNYLILIDDFRVPGDSGYGFGQYSPTKKLDLEYIAPVVDQCNLATFFPRAKSTTETGRKRGCVVLAPKTLAQKVSTCASLVGIDR